MSNPADLPPRLTPRELAAFWRVCVRTVERRAAASLGPKPIRIGARVLYRREDVLAWEQSHVTGGGD